MERYNYLVTDAGGLTLSVLDTQYGTADVQSKNQWGRYIQRGRPMGRRGATDHGHTVNRLNGEDKHKRGTDWEERGN